MIDNFNHYIQPYGRAYDDSNNLFKYITTTATTTYADPCRRLCKNCECASCLSCSCKDCKIARLERLVKDLEASRE